jgi:DeoR family fructose operon transcriptional repressor
MIANLRYTAAPSRREEILRRVRDTGYVSSGRLAAELAVSEMTIRRDLHRLAEAGVVRLVHGGASLPDGAGPGSPFPDRERHGRPAKAAIGAAAAERVAAGTTIALDSGTTTLELARRLPVGMPVTVVTHSLAALAMLSHRADLTVIGLGGLYHESTRSFGGPETWAAAGRLRVDTLYLSASALDRRGVYCATPFEAETKRALIAVADRVVLLADASKPQASAPILTCPYTDIDALITDTTIDPATLHHLRTTIPHITLAR